LSDQARATAGALLSDSGDFVIAGALGGLASNDQSWVIRLRALKDLANFKGDAAAALRRFGLRQDNPEIKLAATSELDPTNSDDVSALLYSAVNEPWDRVRADSDIKLVQSDSEKARTEGYKGVRDDSWFVRVYLLDWLADHPKDDHRDAARIAVADRSPRVRAAALRLFAALPGAVSPDEIQNVLEDRNPEVQLQLLALAKKKDIQIPADEMAAMKTSPDKRVSIATGS
jgi:hypothetical protein